MAGLSSPQAFSISDADNYLGPCKVHVFLSEERNFSVPQVSSFDPRENMNPSLHINVSHDDAEAPPQDTKDYTDSAAPFHS